MAPMSDLIVRDQADYETADLARASLPPQYREFPYAGVWLQPGDIPGLHEMYVFTTRTPNELAAEAWSLITEP